VITLLHCLVLKAGRLFRLVVLVQSQVGAGQVQLLLQVGRVAYFSMDLGAGSVLHVPLLGRVVVHVAAVGPLLVSHVRVRRWLNSSRKCLGELALSKVLVGTDLEIL